MSPILKVLAVLAAVALLVYLGSAILAWRYQDRMAFPAPRSALPQPESLGIPSAQRISIVTSDGVALQGWYLAPDPPPPAGALAPGLIWFYGNMETIEGIAPILAQFRPRGTGMVVLDYRGYGASAGVPTEEGVYRDADGAWEYLAGRPEIDSTRIAVYGRSVGSAVALYLATEKPIRAVILDSPFTSGREMAERHYSFFPSSLVRLSLDNLSRAEQVTVPTLIFHGSDDRITPIEMGRAVARAVRADTMIEIPGAGHNDTYAVGGTMYLQWFHEFLDTNLK
ncbi:MAG: alpha/beta hydrolase [Gemmatimonadota bacterium]|nr:MAG: alpha/beta hydrolase [Gemmatimonadota bacterium]